jgi:hypothetical protein
MRRWIGVVVVLASGCTTQAPWVDCDRKLEPINVPAKPKSLPPPSLVQKQTKALSP